LAEDTASALFGVEGLQVFCAGAEADGSLTVWVVADQPDAACCPDCRVRSGRVHGYVLTRPRDVRRGLDEMSAAWCKRRWKCGNGRCERATSPSRCPRSRRGAG